MAPIPFKNGVVAIVGRGSLAGLLESPLAIIALTALQLHQVNGHDEYYVTPTLDEPGL